MQVPEVFDQHFEAIYQQRWPTLKNALIDAGKKNNKVSVLLKSKINNEAIEFQSKELACVLEPTEPQYYQMDLASVLSVAAIEWKKNSKTLDLCAAPGGKSLTSQFVVNGIGEWHMNDVSQSRLSRLKSVMRQFSPVQPECLHFYKRDASKWGVHEKDEYDFVICDVPCSGEAHLLNSPSHLKKWTPKSSKNLSVRQHAILCSALDAVKPGGTILYSTCSISPVENDEVVRKFLKKRGERAQVEQNQVFPGLEATEFGAIALPDQVSMGPIYYCVIKKFQ